MSNKYTEKCVPLDAFGSIDDHALKIPDKLLIIIRKLFENFNGNEKWRDIVAVAVRAEIPSADRIIFILNEDVGKLQIDDMIWVVMRFFAIDHYCYDQRPLIYSLQNEIVHDHCKYLFIFITFSLTPIHLYVSF